MQCDVAISAPLVIVPEDWNANKVDDWLIDVLIDWVIDWLIDWLIDWCLDA